jgi:hypothetical protein
MDNTKQFTVFNIRKYLQDDGELSEDDLQYILSEFTCPKNPDVERFLKKNAIEFTKKNQSVTYLVFSNDTAELIGYFTLTIKPIQVNSDSNISKGMLKKISRVSEYDEESETFYLSAFLIAQLGKNFTNGANVKITGKQLLEIAIMHLKELQFKIGGTVVFLEAEENEMLFHFYSEKNGFKTFRTRETKNKEPHKLVQMLKVI